MGRFSARQVSVTASAGRKCRLLLPVLLALLLVAGQVSDASAQGRNSLEEFVIDLFGGGRAQPQAPAHGRAQAPAVQQQGTFRAPAVVMQAYDDKGGALADSVPLYYSFANGPAQGLANVPLLSRHSGTTPQAFSPDLGGQSFLGVYVPAGYIARYRAEVVSSAGGECRNLKFSERGEWQTYDIPARNRAALSPLVVAGRGSQFPALGRSQCLLVQWRLNPVQGYPGNTRQLLEQPVVAKNGIANLPATKTLEAAAPGPDGGAVSLTIAENYGAIPRDFRIKAGGQYVSLLHNLGAPTDDGMIWGISMNEAVGLYGQADAPTDLGSSQFCGHADAGTRFSGAMWGMHMPLEQRGSALTPARQCGGEPCFVPMHSDWASSAMESGGTFPFLFPRSIQPWDGQVAKISLEPYKAQSGVLRLTYSMNYRVHKDFSAARVHPHLWFSQAMTDNDRNDAPRPVNVHLVHVDGKVTSLPYSALTNADSGAAWDAFCAGDGFRSHCGSNAKRKGDVTCQCSFGKPQVKRVIYEYFKDDVAVALSASGQGFGKLIVTTQFMSQTKGRPALLTSAANVYHEAKEEYRAGAAVSNDTYFFEVGTMNNLKKAGLMQ